MDSYTLFSHIVHSAGTHICTRAHIELQGLGILPKSSLEDPAPLSEHDADIRAAFAIWCGLAIPTQTDGAGKRFFNMVKSGMGKVPVSKDGENFILKLAEILRQGERSNVLHVYIGHVLTGEDGFNGLAQIIYKDGTGTTYHAGEEFPVYNYGTQLDDLKLAQISRDLKTVTRSWPERTPQTARLHFVGGLIQID